MHQQKQLVTENSEVSKFSLLLLDVNISKVYVESITFPILISIHSYYASVSCTQFVLLLKLLNLWMVSKYL